MFIYIFVIDIGVLILFFLKSKIYLPDKQKEQPFLFAFPDFKNCTIAGLHI